MDLPINTFIGLFILSISRSKRSLIIFPPAAMQRVESTKRKKPKWLSVMATLKGSKSANLIKHWTKAIMARF